MKKGLATKIAVQHNVFNDLPYSEELKNEVIQDIKSNIDDVVKSIKWGYEYDKKTLRKYKIATDATGYSESAVVGMYKGVPIAGMSWEWGAIDGFAIAEPFQRLGLGYKIIKETKDQEGGKLKIASPNPKMQSMLKKHWNITEIKEGEDIWSVEEK